MKIAARDISRLLSSPDPRFKAYLFYGPDFGMISERAEIIAQHIHPSDDNSFAVTSLSGSEISQDKTLVSDSLNAIPMFGGTRVVVLTGDGNELTESVKLALEQMSGDSRLIIRARQVNTRHALVKLCDNTPHCASVGCYADDDRSLADLARSVFETHNISVSADVLLVLTEKLGSDRQASRQELEKLALFAADKGHLDVSDIDDMLGDGAAIETDSLCIAVLSGQTQKLSVHLSRLQLEAVQPVSVIRQLTGMFMILQKARTVSGAPDPQALSSLRPPLHFKIKPVLSAQLRLWPLPQIRDALAKLTQLETDLKSSNSANPYSIMGQVLLGLTLRAQALNKRR